jgi:hypothetical protein
MRTQRQSDWRQNSNTLSKTSSLGQGCDVAGRSFILIYKSAKDSIQYSGAFLVAATVSHYFFSFATMPLLSISATIFLTRTVVRILKSIPSEKVKDLQKQLLDLDKKYPKLSYIILITSLVASPFFPSVSITIGVGYGVYMGMWIDVEKNKRRFEEASEEASKTINVTKSKPLI